MKIRAKTTNLVLRLLIMLLILLTTGTALLHSKDQIEGMKRESVFNTDYLYENVKVVFDESINNLSDDENVRVIYVMDNDSHVFGSGTSYLGQNIIEVDSDSSFVEEAEKIYNVNNQERVEKIESGTIIYNGIIVVALSILGLYLISTLFWIIDVIGDFLTGLFKRKTK